MKTNMMTNVLSLTTFFYASLVLFGGMGGFLVAAHDDCPDGILFELELLTDEVPEDISYEIYHMDLSSSPLPDYWWIFNPTNFGGSCDISSGYWWWCYDNPPLVGYDDDDYFDDHVPDPVGDLVVEGTGFDAPDTLYKRSHCLTETGWYEFFIYDASGDGLCCDSGPGFYTTFVNGEIERFGDVFGYVQRDVFYSSLPSPPTPAPEPTSAPEPTPAPTPEPCSVSGNWCSSDSDCCSNKCRGKKGSKTCKRG